MLAEVSQSINGANPGSVSTGGNDELQGWVKSDVGYKLCFDAIFDRPFTASGVWDASGTAAGAYATFDTTRDQTVTMRVAISYVDQAGASKNLAAELPPDRSFGQVRRAARTDWNGRLNGVAIEGGTLAGWETFYDNLYRALLMPSVFDDADGSYLGVDGAVHLRSTLNR